MSKKYQVIAFCDNDQYKWGKRLCDIPVVFPDNLLDMSYDLIVIGTASGFESVYRQLVQEMGISNSKIVNDECVTRNIASAVARRNALRGASSIILSKGPNGAVAELGVYQGEFAKMINEAFPDNTLYLFDTFEGFSQNDILIERQIDNPEFEAGDFSFTNVGMVIGKMPHKDKCIVRKGYFPNTAQDIDDHFVFVSMDVDLYLPTLEGLKYFYPRMVKGGFIFVHDYFSNFTGVKKAVDEFASTSDMHFAPLGDNHSVVVVK